MKETKLMLGHKIKSLREIKGFSQDYVSAKFNISQNALSKIEKGEIKVSFDKACELAEILETDVNTLINFDPKNSFNHCNQCGVINTITLNSDAKLIEELLKAKDEIIREKEEKVQMLLKQQTK